MLKKVIIVQNKLGLHARPCSLLVKAAGKFRSEFQIRKEKMEVNGKSILGVMMLAAEYGSELELVFDGVDEEEAMETIVNLIESCFGEE
ncbi:MAG: HPr family phosphocarrier protein [Candidatus Cloacimonetes bacterium]|nr:HPr family phosphocarrier protein [Candidatus Cloacimonadota bacterium]